MKFAVFLWALVAVSVAYPAEELESVVSVYTTQATTAGTATHDVYHQIAANIAERITSPIYKFLDNIGVKKNTNQRTTTEKPWSKIELLDDPDYVKYVKPISNDITTIKDEDNEIFTIKDVEKGTESTKGDSKPEKITLYSNHLDGQRGKTAKAAKITTLPFMNDTFNDITVSDDESIASENNMDDSELERNDRNSFIEFDTPKQNNVTGTDSVTGPFVYFLELLTSFFQLALGALQSLFTPKADNL